MSRYPAAWLAANITKPPTLWSDEWTTPNRRATAASAATTSPKSASEAAHGFAALSLPSSAGLALRCKRTLTNSAAVETLALGVNGSRAEA